MKAMAPHSSTLAWRIPWMEEPGRLQSMGLLRVGHDWATSLSLFTFMHWRRKWQPTPVFLPEESQGWGSLVGCCLWGRTELDMTEATSQRQQQGPCSWAGGGACLIWNQWASWDVHQSVCSVCVCVCVCARACACMHLRGAPKRNLMSPRILPKGLWLMECFQPLLYSKYFSDSWAERCDFQVRFKIIEPSEDQKHITGVLRQWYKVDVTYPFRWKWESHCQLSYDILYKAHISKVHGESASPHLGEWKQQDALYRCREDKILHLLP